ncbi:amidohydrolase family protein [Crocinitomicaceae bacterium]|nr:amidohydrolase family protein [Crocinitomicaceae bacterium]
MKSLLFIGFLFLWNLGMAQSEPNNGMKDSKPTFYALKNATIYVSPTIKLSNAVLLIKRSKIETIGKSGLVKIPKEAVVIDCKNKTILPAFIDLNSSIGISKEIAQSNKSDGVYYWNRAIRPEVDASKLYKYDETAANKMIHKGFGFVLTHQEDGVSRGKGALVSLSAEPESNLSSTIDASYFSFEKGSSKQRYPSSQMGAIALLRQAFYDAQWHQENQNYLNLSLDELNRQKTSTMFFKTRDKLEILRAQKIASEFDITFNYLGSGNEYEIVNELSKLHSTVVLPLNFPQAYDVKNPYISRQIPLGELKHWELAPMNPSILQKNGVNICLSGKNLSSKDFWSNLRRTIAHGLSIEEALNALTLEPAKTIDVQNQLGSLEEGKYASFTIYNLNPLEEEAKILESWQLGNRTIHDELSTENEILGKYNVTLNGTKYPIEIKSGGGKKTLKGTLRYKQLEKGIAKDTTVNLYVFHDKNDITLQFNINNHEMNGSIALRGKVISRMGVFEGEGLLPNGKWVKWTAIRSSRSKSKEKEKGFIVPADTSIEVWYPNLAYGFTKLPEQEPLIIKNATVWTNEAAGILERATVVVKNGKITFVGSGNYPTPLGARIIDAKGKHITSGIIDEHSHIAISKGVNESGQAISSEVSIADVVNPKDINIYRQLSGGVTTAQLLHGSANPIGGQSALIKLKWGFPAEKMLIDKAPDFIKFALGENVKQSSSNYSKRFPRTRMGVEQVYYDAFTRALAYEKEWQLWKDGASEKKPRVDLELDILLEILKRERFVTCHSYIQSEINMLMHVADSMGFNINTFTHILEGYKLADKMVKHGAGGSTFSDWWAYKYEVNDAIPYNAAMMNAQGVIVAINSDDAEMGRRLNQEAAKGIKYGGMDEQEAWKMITLNPAKLLHLDDQMGSLKVGKDADIVVWSDHPLSIAAKVEYTIVDGMVLFDKVRDAEMRMFNQKEKARIVSKMLQDNNSGGKKRSFQKKKKGHYHCNTIGEEKSTEENHH